MISANNVTLRIGKKALFEDVNIKFTEGNCYGLIGANGAGKTTTIKAVAGILGFEEGQIYIERLVPYDQAGSIARIRKYGQVVQEEFLAEGISVKAYVPMEVYSQI